MEDEPKGKVLELTGAYATIWLSNDAILEKNFSYGCEQKPVPTTDPLSLYYQLLQERGLVRIFLDLSYSPDQLPADRSYLNSLPNLALYDRSERIRRDKTAQPIVKYIPRTENFEYWKTIKNLKYPWLNQYYPMEEELDNGNISTADIYPAASTVLDLLLAKHNLH